MKNKYSIELADIVINILTEESDEYVKEITEITNERIKNIITNGDHVSKIEAALFCALDYCSDKHKLQKKLTSAEAQIALYLASINRLQAENDELRARLEATEQKNDRKEQQN
ncbi:MAG: cell division protein ZapA [Clostridiales bacterium]|nr:cell division protein ZapA [Clostridiales bacterium]